MSFREEKRKNIEFANLINIFQYLVSHHPPATQRKRISPQLMPPPKISMGNCPFFRPFFCSVPTTYPNLIAEEEEEEARKYVYVGQAVDSQPDLESGEVENVDPIPVAPPRRPKTLDVPSAQTATSSPTVPSVTFNVDDTGAEGDAEHSGNESDTNSTTKWLEKVPLPKILRNR